MDNTDQAISELVEEFKQRSAWRQQSDILGRVSRLASFRHRPLIETLSSSCVSPFVYQRLKGVLRTLDSVEQRRILHVRAAEQSATPISSFPESDEDVAAHKMEDQVSGEPPGEYLDESTKDFEFDACNLSIEDRQLLARAIKKVSEDSSGVKIRELNRGFSGSDVYLVKIKKKREDGFVGVMPKSLVAKIGDAQKLSREHANAQEAFLLASAHSTVFEECGTRACLLQEFASSGFDDKTTSLKTALSASYRQRDEKRAMERVLQYVDGVHREIVVRNGLNVETTKSVIEATKICGEQIKIARLEARFKIIGVSSRETHIENKFRLALVNPFWYLLKLQNERPPIRYYSQPLHGDLHTENIQIDSADVVHSIDWGNYGFGHSSLDYALLETSVWAHCASHDLLVEELDRAMREIPFPGELGSLDVDPLSDDGHPLTRCKAVAKRIRAHASTVLYDPKPFDYAIGLFFCAVQQLQYEDANLRAMLLLANQAIQRLEEEWGYIPE